MYLKLYSIDHSAIAASKADNKLHLRPYQEVGRDWLLNNKRAMLTDWPGLGKTIEASEAAKNHKPVLISAPTYLTEQWYDHLTRQYPGDTIVLATGATMHKFDRQARLNEKADWYIVNHAMMRVEEVRDEDTDDLKYEPLFKLPKVQTVILDESHHFRNRTALQSIGAARFTRGENMRVYQLTASPVWKNMDDIWMQLHILQPRIFSSYNDFCDTFLIVDETLYGPKILGVKRSVKKQLDALLSIVKFGRTYKQVGRYLPETIKSEIKIPFPDELMKKYREILQGYILSVGEDEAMIFSSYIEILHTLRMITNWPGKQKALKDRLDDVGKPALVFTWYKETAYELGTMLGGYKKATVITGDVKPSDRPAYAREAYKAGRHVVANLHAMSEGVNLQELRHVVFYEEDWPPGKNFQALSRVVRDRNDGGLDREPVLVDYLMVPRTVDSIIHAVSQRREASIKDLMQEILM